MWIEEERRAKLLTTVHSWICVGSLKWGFPFQEFESSFVAELRHAFISR